jgi:hypothetical protein
MAKLARYIHRLAAGFMNVGQLRSDMVSVATVTVVNMKIISGHGCSGFDEKDRCLDQYPT